MNYNEYNLPPKFKAHYEGDCGEEYELWGAGIPELKLPCEECGISHKFKLIRIEHYWL